MAAEIIGVITDIQRFCLHDGPGVRTVVFLKGCNMRCHWCHNPETLAGAPQLFYAKNACVGCGQCEGVCPSHAHHFAEGQHSIIFEDCIACGRCIDACGYQAVRMSGTCMTVPGVIANVCEDRLFYQNSGGGVTFSGGEPTVQPDFLEALVQASHARHIHTCVETNGYNTGIIRRVMPYVDIFLVDYKHHDDDAHRAYTGLGLTPVLDTLRFLEAAGKPVILRCPIIPGINDTQAHEAAIAAVKGQYVNILEAERMPYHTYGIHKWEAVGMTCPMGNA